MENITIAVQQINQESEGVISLLLTGVDSNELPAWTPGAHIGLKLDGGIERQYSLCGKTADRSHWQVAVLREPESRGGSAWIHSQLRVGDQLKATPPSNQFPLVEAPFYLFIGGGIGITPLIPMIEAVEKQGKPWRLVYGGRKLDSMAFVKQLAAYGDKVEFRPEDQFGLLDLASLVSGLPSGGVIYSCGPERLLAALENECKDLPEGTLHIERFRARPGALDGPQGSFEVVLSKTGKSCQVAADESIIDALDRIGYHVPRSCGEGTCGTCITSVVEGTPDHRDSFLMGKRRASNKFVCVCCSRSLSPRLVLDL